MHPPVPGIRKIAIDFGEQRVNFNSPAETRDYVENRWLQFGDVRVPRGFTVILENNAELEVDMTSGQACVVATHGENARFDARLLRRAVALAASASPPGNTHKYTLGDVYMTKIEPIDSEYRRYRTHPGAGKTDERIRRTAEIIEQARLSGKNVLQAIIDEQHVDYGTARDYRDQVFGRGFAVKNPG